jgi:cytochrome o ubiquinol oxidase subunit 1
VFNWLFTMYRGQIHFKTPMMWFLAFVVTFTIGGAAGVLMSIPAADFQLHNTLFLVAHFHTMIVGGVLFGYFAGFSYWFPKIFGFRLNERLGRYALWSWLIGFVLAFVPLYILGIMGATRRLDHYDAGLGWQWLFIIAGIGVLVILMGVGFQIAQLVVSIVTRYDNRDLTGDPWDGRTLEWSVPSPAPVYNFAVIPTVTDRDAFWETKQSELPTSPVVYTDIHLPKNSGMGIIIAGFAFLFGFAIIWHIWWLMVIGLFGIIGSIIVRASDDDTEETITAAEVARIEAACAQRSTV